MTEPASLVHQSEPNPPRGHRPGDRPAVPAAAERPVRRLKVALVDLDGKTMPDWVPESLSREQIELVVGDSKTRDELARCAGDADVVWLFGGSRILMNGNLAAVPRCWAILRTGSGTDNVPVEEATQRGIVVANTPAAFSDAVSDHVLALLFAALRRIPLLDRRVRLGRWNPNDAEPLNTIQSRTLGFIGFGNIARQVIRKLSGFSLNVLVHDPYVGEEAVKEGGAHSVPLERLLAESDFISLHCPLTPKTRHLIGEAELRLMKPSAVLINTSRGAVIDERALVAALARRGIAAAALDVVEEEPPAAGSPLLEADNVILTPHVAGLSAAGMEMRWRTSLEALGALAHRRWPPSPVNRDVRPIEPLSP